MTRDTPAVELLRRPLTAPAWMAGLGGLALFAFGATVGEGPGADAGASTATVTETITETVTESSSSPAVDAAGSEIAVARERLERLESDLDARGEQLARRDRRLDRRKTRLDERAAALEDRQQQLVAESAPEPEPDAVFYDNCDDARAAGAAPVHQGDPGYGPHLDADGDGIGCDT